MAKTIEHKATIAGAIGNAISEVENLRDEMTEWKDNLEEKFSATEKYERVSEAADALEDVCNTSLEIPELPKGMLDEVTWNTYKKSKKSRRDRAGDAQLALQAAIEHVNNFIDEHDDDEDECYKDSSLDDWKLLVETLEEVNDNLDGVEFPGAFGG